MDPEKLLAFDRKLVEFQSESHWRLSLSAQAILRHAFIALMTDYLGLPGYTTSAKREEIQGRVLETMERFLSEIAEKAEAAADKQGLTSEQKTIGAIFILQNIKRLAEMISCECWP